MLAPPPKKRNKLVPQKSSLKGSLLTITVNCVVLSVDMKIAELLNCFVAAMGKNNLAMKQFNNRKSRGFTLIELLIVMVIIGILVAATIVAVNPLRNINQAKEANLKTDMAQIVLALKAYLTTHEGKYPDVSSPPLQELVVSKDLDTLPQQPDGSDYQYQRSSTCDSSGCSSVIWGKLYNSAPGSVWCWDSTSNKYKESSSAPAAGDTTCP